MNDRNAPCTACFADGSRPQCRVFDSSGGALTIYSGLHASGRFAAMCLQADGRYRVCQEAEKGAATLPPPRARAA